MTIFNLLSAEFAKLAASKAILLSVIAALLVPVVYGGILLSATWGPYDNLSNLPVAVVNNDKGAVSGDQAINVGDDLVANLKSGKDLGWKFVNSTAAMKGLQKDDYYMAIIIPEDFSHRVTTVLDPNPKKLELEYIQNEGLNFLASKVTETATQRIREKLGDTITEQYVAKVFSSLGDVSTGFGKAADGSSQLADGTTKLHKGTSDLVSSVTSKQSDITKLANGTKELKSGTGLLLSNLNDKSGDIQKLSDGSSQLHDGTVTLHNGTVSLHDGTVSLKDGTSQILGGLQKAQAGSQTLNDGVSQKLVPGSRKVADGTGKLKVGSAKLAAGAQKLVAGLKEYKKANPTVNVGPYYQQIIDGAEEISAGLTSLSSKSVALNDGAVSVADGIAYKVAPGTAALNDGLNKLVAGQIKVDAGAGKLEAGAGKLEAGSSKLEAGAGQIADGNAKVNKGWGDLTTGVSKLDAGAGKISDGNQKVDEGWKRLSAGATKLNDGAGKINDGSEKLSSGLKTGAEKTGGLNKTNDNIKMFAAPVKLKSASVNEYHHYRDSTAPYVLTLGLFAGILIMSLFIDFKRPSFVSSFNWFAVKFMNLAGLAIVQAILLLAVVLLILRVDVSNPFGLILFAIVVSVVFSAIVLFLAALGGNVGRFIALGFVILQLSITGANLPIEMLPENLRSLSEYLPFTYSIAGFKDVISLNNIGSAFSNMFILLTYLVVFAFLSFVVFNFKKKSVQKTDREAMA
ncbi:YhgE/Pip domain-containing protein [Fictibacillus barbaricus]|uniref:Membrane protein n=1 Tax=Fictibacillus barbaricus TaxID=182136 RepID=A0ABU1U4D8_9BACL|nr:YhgE/Pip domain-containing protein [Fictibacillus barbaricus]MDR7074251.1 putative membrane protein [Fictibacillus barbaricus]